MEEPRSHRRRVLRLVQPVLRVASALLGTVVLLVLLLLLALQTPWAAHRAVGLALDLFNPLQGASLQVGHVAGNFVTHLTLRDVGVVRDDGRTLVHIDTLATRFKLLELFGRRLHLYEVRVAQPSIALQQDADGTWDLLHLLPAEADDEPEDPTSRPFEVLVEDARLSRGDLRLAFYDPDGDSTLHAADLGLHLAQLHVAETPTVALDSLWGTVSMDEAPGPAHLRLAATLDAQRLHVGHLTFEAPGSRIAGRGTIGLASNGEAGPATDFTLEATPLALGDLRFLSPAFPAEEMLTLHVQAQGSGQVLEVDAEAHLSSGGSVVLNAAGTPGQDGPHSYRLTGTVRQLDPALLAGAASGLAGRVNGDLHLDLQGPARDRLTGTFGATLFDTRLGSYTLARTTLDGTLRDGLATFDLRSGLRGAALALSGTLRPADARPAYDLRASVRHLDLGALLDDTTLTSDLEGRLQLTGTGFDPRAADARLAFTLAPARIGQLDVDASRLSAELAQGRLTFRADLGAAQGRVVAAGRVDLGDELAYRIEEGRIEHLNLAPFMGSTDSSVVNGTFFVDGMGTDPDDMRLRARAEVFDTALLPGRLEAATLQASLDGGRLEATGAADLAGGRMRLALHGRPFDAVPRLTLTNGTLEHVDLGALLGTSGQQSDLNGTFSASLRGFEPERMDLAAQLDLTASRLNQQPIDEGYARVTLRGGALAFDADLRMASSAVALGGTARPFLETPTFTLERGTFNNLDLGALAGLAGWSTTLNGTVALDGLGRDPAHMTLRSRLTLEPSRLNRAALTDGYVDVALDAGTARLDAAARLGTGTLTLAAHGTPFAEVPRYEARAAADALMLGALLSADSLQSHVSARLAVEGTGLDPETMHLSARFEADSTVYDQIVVRQARGALQLDAGIARIDTLTLASNVAALTGGGTLALFGTHNTRPSTFTFAAEAGDLMPLAPLLGAEHLALAAGHLSGRLSGSTKARLLAVDLDLSGLAYDDLRLDSLRGRVSGELAPDGRPRHAAARLAATALQGAGVPLARADLDASYRPDSVVFGTAFTLDARRSGRLHGRVALLEDGQRVTLDTVALHLGENHWTLLQEAVVTVGDAYRVRNLLLYAPGQQLAVDGVIDPRGEQHLLLTLEQFRLGDVAGLFGLPNLDGIANGYVDLAGPAASPLLRGGLTLDLLLADTTTSRVATDFSYAAGQLMLDARAVAPGQHSLTLTGTLPIDLSLAPADAAAPPTAAGEASIDLALRAEHFPIGWTKAFLDPAVSQIAGTFTSDLHITGTLERPMLDGRLALSDGRLGLPPLGVTYRDVALDAAFAGRRMSLDRFQMRSRAGRLTGTGHVQLDTLALGRSDLQFTARDFEALARDDARALVDADLTLRGTIEAPVVAGQVRVIRSEIFVGEGMAGASAEPITLTEAQQAVLEERFGIRLGEERAPTVDVYAGLALDVDVRLERDTWLRSWYNPRMDIQFSGDLDVQKKPAGELLLFGNIEVSDRSSVSYLGRKFVIDKGALTFNGPPTDLAMDIETVYEVQNTRRSEDVEIALQVQGRPDDMKLTLTSDPQMDQTDIMSYLVFGQPASEASQTANPGETAGSALLSSQLSALARQTAGAQLGIDFVEIDLDPSRGTTLTIGKYLTPAFYAALSQPISSASQADGTQNNQHTTDVTLEYALRQNLLLRLITLENQLRLGLQWQRFY